MQINLSILLLLLSLTSACSFISTIKAIEPPQTTSGERMLMESKGIAQLGEHWLEGQKRIRQGETLIREGQLIIQEGRHLIVEGGNIQKESEDNYKNIKKQAVTSFVSQ